MFNVSCSLSEQTLCLCEMKIAYLMLSSVTLATKDETSRGVAKACLLSEMTVNGDG